MSVRDRHIDNTAGVARETVVLGVQTVGNSETDTLFDAFKPGYDFEIVAVEHFAEAVTATATYMVKKNAVDALSGETTPTADTRGDATLSSTLSALQGDNDDVLNLHCTTNGAGAFTGLKVKVTIRPRFLHGDPPKYL